MRSLLLAAALVSALFMPGPAQAATPMHYHDASGEVSALVNCHVTWLFEFDHSGQPGQKPQAHASDKIIGVTCTDHKTHAFAAHIAVICAYTGRLLFYRKVNGNAIVTVRGRVTQARCPVILPLSEKAWLIQVGLWIKFANGWKYFQDLCLTRVPDTNITRKCGP